MACKRLMLRNSSNTNVELSPTTLAELLSGFDITANGDEIKPKLAMSKSEEL
jgi:hypothetical protein